MDRRVLVVGSGGREHALCWRLAVDGDVEHLVVAPGNPGMRDVAVVAPVAPDDVDALLALIVREAIELVVIGPEASLVNGLADRIRSMGVAVVGPDAGAARLEGSKSFCREVARAAGVRMAAGGTFTDVGMAMDHVRTRGGQVVVKADGLAAGKGVVVCGDVETAEQAVRSCLVDGAFGDAGRDVVIEERLAGVEVSIIALCDETAVLALPAARDHKRLGDDDSGPNTGGMGAISPVEDPNEAQVAQLVATVHRPILDELARRGLLFRGILFAGMMLTGDGPVLLECNVRFGDPETQATLPRLAGPLLPLLSATARGGLREAAVAAGIRGVLLPVRPDAAVAVVVAAAGYPGSPRPGDPIVGLEAARASDALVFCAGVTADAGGRLVTAGGRVLTVVGRGATLAAAADHAYAGVDRLTVEGMQVRRDIGRTLAHVGHGT